MSYVRKRLDEMTRKERLKQHLSWNMAGIAGDLDLVEVDTPRLWDVTVKTTVSAGEVVAYDSSMKEVARQPIAGHELHFQLPPDFYKFQVMPGGPDKLCEIGPGEENAVAL